MKSVASSVIEPLQESGRDALRLLDTIREQPLFSNVAVTLAGNGLDRGRSVKREDVDPPVDAKVVSKLNRELLHVPALRHQVLVKVIYTFPANGMF